MCVAMRVGGACGCWGSAEGVHRRAESKVFHQDLLSCLEMGTDSKKKPQIF